MKKNLRCVGLLTIALALGVASPAPAHHSHAMFDHAQEVAVTGTVKEFVFRNPHVMLYVDVRSERGEVAPYWVEMSNIPNMIRRGITQSTFKAGDVVTVRVHPLKDGRPGGNYVTVTAGDGKTYE